MDEKQISRVGSPQALARADYQPIREATVVDVATEEVPHLLDYWDVVLKRRWVVLSCLLVVFTTFAIGTLKQRPMYEGTVEIEIDPETPSVVNFREVVPVSPVDLDSYRETQYKILQSRTLAEKVIKDLQLYRNPDLNRKYTFFGLIDDGPGPMPPASELGPPDPSTDAYRSTLKTFMDRVDVNPVRRSDLVEISFDSHDPQLAARAANQLADDYAQENLQTKFDETMQASQWLAGQLKDMKIKLQASEDKLQQYAQQNGIVFVTDKQMLVTARLQELQSDLTKAQNDRVQAEALYSQIHDGNMDDLPGIIDNRVIQDMVEKKSELDRQYAELTTTVKPSYPKAVQLKRQIDSIQKEIDHQKHLVMKNIVDSYHTALTREKDLTKEVATAAKNVDQVSRKGIQWNILKREVDSNQQLYDGLLDRMKEAGVAAGLKASNIHTVDPAVVPRSPVKPRVLLNLALGLVLGLGLGVGLAFFQEYLDKTLKSADDVEQLLRLPSLGILPRFSLEGAGKTGETHLVAAGSNGHQALAPGVQIAPEAVEAFRSLRTSILLSASPVPKLLLVTSALPSEGKTTTAINLGATLASLGHKVVVVDCDMRRPACHRSAGVENQPGFVQCLTGHVDLTGAVLPVPGVENLYVIPCGPIPPNPAEVLSSPLAGDLLRRLREQFEYVLVDSPPLLSVADSRILATLTDAVILVTRAHATPHDIVRRARSLLYGSGARILGVALNDVDLHREGLGYQQYQYGYGYSADDAASGDHA